MPTIYIEDKSKLPKRKDFDFYPTPIELCKKAILTLPYLGINDSISILDPGAGNGVWGKAFREVYRDFPFVVSGVELREVEPPIGYTYWITDDYLSNNWHRPDVKFDIIIGNPPYKYANQFLLKSFDLLKDGGYILFLLKLSFLESGLRYHTFYNNNLNPKEVHVCVQRIDFYSNMPDKPKGSGNSEAFGIFIWKKDWKGETTLKWLNWR